jgi:alkylation response protein AidB-like acyl-CoA dehydrogenase
MIAVVDIVASLPGQGHALLDALKQALPRIGECAVEDDRTAAFPVATFAILHDIGLTTAVIPEHHGGLGLGNDRASTRILVRALHCLGGAHLAAARLFEGHVNAFRLLWRYGDAALHGRLRRYVRDGGLLGVWNAPAPEGPLRLLGHAGGHVLQGRKIYASGSGTIERPLVTAIDEQGRLLMLWPPMTHATIDLSAWNVQGMRASMTGSVTFEAAPVAAEDIVGGDNDYHRQPDFSAGAWRFLAAQLGAAAALHDLTRAHLLGAGRDADPHQRARLADAAVGIESARLWVDAAARLAETSSDAEEGVRAVDYVGMARMAVERSALEVMALAQRSVGLSSLMATSPMERIVRDLSTYLRQPAPDAVRDGVASAVLASNEGALERWSR